MGLTGSPPCSGRRGLWPGLLGRALGVRPAPAPRPVMDGVGLQASAGEGDGPVPRVPDHRVLGGGGVAHMDRQEQRAPREEREAAGAGGAGRQCPRRERAQLLQVRAQLLQVRLPGSSPHCSCELWPSLEAPAASRGPPASTGPQRSLPQGDCVELEPHWVALRPGSAQ